MIEQVGQASHAPVTLKPRTRQARSTSRLAETAKRVRMLGALSQSETLKILSLLSACVLSSRWEGLPLIALESMWMGIPVVSMNVSGMSEVIEDGIDGVLVDQRSGECLANGVRKVTQDSSLSAFIVQNARSKVQEKFSEDQMLQSLCRVYQEIQPKDGNWARKSCANN